MTRFRIICPECSAVVITPNRLAAVLEVCPSCKRHVWDLYDALMADLVNPESGKVITRQAQV